MHDGTRIAFATMVTALWLCLAGNAGASNSGLVEGIADDAIGIAQPPVGAAPENTTVDLLRQLPSGYGLPYRDTRAVAQEFDWLLRHPDYLERVFTRARPYLPYIYHELQRRDMPMELVLLPVVESAYDPFAYSHGQAAGLWQFIPGTATHFGVSQNWWYDGRRDLLDSTAAAITYLDKLQRMFDGDWLLAIAAYNSGEGKVRRELRRAGGDATFWELRLPRETRAYVPRLLALSRLVAAPGDFGITLPEVIDTPQFEVVQTGGQLDLAVAAELTGLSVDTLYRFNPGLNRWATPPQGPHRLLIPANYAGLLRDGLAELPAAQRVTWKRYRIAPGDTLSSIAAAHRITIESLRDSNDLRGSMIRAGQYLMIPTASRKSRDYRLSASQRLQQRTVATARDVEYTVRPGDSLWTIARGYGVDVRRLASWNGMAPKDTLQAGRRLVIRDVVNDDPAVVGPPSTQRRINYTVRRGDSLARISSKFSVSIAQIRKWNRNVANQKYLYPGQKLVMYIDVTRQSGG